jgi:hypothetical protein
MHERTVDADDVEVEMEVQAAAGIEVLEEAAAESNEMRTTIPGRVSRWKTHLQSPEESPKSGRVSRWKTHLMVEVDKNYERSTSLGGSKLMVEVDSKSKKHNGSRNDGMDISEMLTKSKKEGKKRQMRITGTCFLVGFLGILLGIVVQNQKPSTAEGQGNLQRLVGGMLVYLSSSVLLLGVLPSDVKAIRVANGLVLFLCATQSILALFGAAAMVLIGMQRGWTFPRIMRAVLLCAVTANFITQMVRLTAATYLPPRARLDKVWRVFGQWQLITALICGILALFFVDDVPQGDELSNRLLGFAVYATVNGGICVWPNFRVRAQAFLSNRGETGSLAAAVATAIGGNSVEETQKKAGKLLRYVTLDKISKEELAENKPNQLLFERSLLGTFGEIDAFISHSWSDPSESKWEGLQSWRNSFKRQYGREPRVWFDKCCIDQLHIDDSLLCLPVHLAACQKVLMLVGPSYLTRLWCVMEIFVLIAAVNDVTRLECIALSESREKSPSASQAQAEEDVLSSFRAFSVGTSTCYDSATRDKLLCIIEAGCGTLDAFNALVRNIQLSFSASSSGNGSKLASQQADIYVAL